MRDNLRCGHRGRGRGTVGGETQPRPEALFRFRPGLFFRSFHLTTVRLARARDSDSASGGMRRRTPAPANAIAMRLLPTRRSLLVSSAWVAWFLVGQRYALSSLLGDLGGDASPERRARRRRRRTIAGHTVSGMPVHGLHADGSDFEYRCRPGEVVSRPKAYRLWGGLNGTRRPLPSPLSDPGVFDFGVTVSEMDLRVLVAGNSLGEQLHASLEGAACYPVYMLDASERGSRERQVLAKMSTCETHLGSHANWTWSREPRVAVQKDGRGGLLAVVKDNSGRVDTRSKWDAGSPGMRTLLGTLRKAQQASHNSTTEDDDDGSLLDVLVSQWPSGHIGLDRFDDDFLDQSVLAASALFGATSVVFPTVAWMNNVNSSQVELLREVNDRIRRYAADYEQGADSTVESVLVLDIAELIGQYIEANAEVLGVPKEEVWTARIDSMWNSLVAHICASMPFDDDPRGCSPGMVSVSEREDPFCQIVTSRRRAVCSKARDRGEIVRCPDCTWARGSLPRIFFSMYLPAPHLSFSSPHSIIPVRAQFIGSA